MNLQQTIDSAVKEFKKSIYKSGNGYHLLIPEMLGVQPTLEHFISYFESHLTSSIKKAVEEAYKAIEVEKRGTKNYTNSHDAVMNGDKDYGYNEALSLIEKKKSEFLNK
jgi:hypothetical protein